MRFLFAFFTTIAYCTAHPQTDSVKTKDLNSDSTNSRSLPKNTDFVNVCRNDTMWLYDWQYDSAMYYRRKGLGMRIHTTNTRSDTTLRIGKEEYFPEEFHGWLRDYLCEWWDCTYNYIYYNTGELHMTFMDYGEGHMGEFKEYHKNGNVTCTGMYCSDNPGVKYGIWKWYDESGTLTHTKTYKGGKYCLEPDTKARRIYPFWRK